MERFVFCRAGHTHKRLNALQGENGLNKPNKMKDNLKNTEKIYIFLVQIIPAINCLFNTMKCANHNKNSHSNGLSSSLDTGKMNENIKFNKNIQMCPYTCTYIYVKHIC